MKQSQKKQLIKIGLCILMTFLMVLSSELLHEKEIIFPEIAALITGAWACPKSLWNVSRLKMCILMTASAAAGIIIVRFLPLPLLAQIMVGFAFTAVLLTFSKTTLVPMISACILPILMHTNTMIYPISVCVMMVMITLVQYILEKKSIKAPLIYMPCIYNKKEQWNLWIKRSLCLLLMAIIPMAVKQYYFIAPPLIVTFVEFTNINSKLRKKTGNIFFLIITAALCGTLLRMAHETFAIPLSLCAAVIMGILFILFQFTDTMFPPAGAVALLPLILSPAHYIYLYPIEIAIGAAGFLSLAFTLFRKDSEPSITENLGTFMKRLFAKTDRAA